MDAKRIKESQRRLAVEDENLIKSINRNRAANAETTSRPSQMVPAGWRTDETNFDISSI